jgi:hypothetical protein
MNSLIYEDRQVVSLWLKLHTYHPVEFCALVALRFALRGFGLPSAELAKVFSRLGCDVLEEFHCDSAERLACVGDVSILRDEMCFDVGFSLVDAEAQVCRP